MLAGMRVIETLQELRHQVQVARGRSERVGLVPLFGPGHEGWVRLLRIAQAQCDLVIAVVPGNRTAALAEHADIVWDPTMVLGHDVRGVIRIDQAVLKGLAGRGRDTARVLEDGVVAIVRSICACMPDVVYMSTAQVHLAHGVRVMLDELLLDVPVRFAPPARDGDGIVISAQTEDLHGAEREVARLLPAALDRVEADIAAGERSLGRLRARVAVAVSDAPEADLRYVEFIDPETLIPVRAWKPGLGIVAGMRVGDRQITDVRLETPPAERA